jgi:hypothetical protein
MSQKVERLKQLEREHGIEFLTRFACLIEAVNLTCDKAEELGIDTETSNLWIKPIAFHHYIDERQKDMRYNIERYLRGEEE